MAVTREHWRWGIIFHLTEKISVMMGPYGDDVDSSNLVFPSCYVGSGLFEGPSLETNSNPKLITMYLDFDYSHYIRIP